MLWFKRAERFVLIAVVGLAVLGGAVSGANATVIEITSIENGNSGGFGYSGFHKATGCGGMCGASLARMTGLWGGANTYNSATGDIAFAALLDNGAANAYHAANTVATITGNLDFSVAIGEIIGTLDVVFNNALNGINSTVVTFLNWDYGGIDPVDPNSVNPTYLALWGADSDPVGSLPSGNGKFYTGSDYLGMDLVLGLEAYNLPEPASAGLLGVGMIGFGAYRRRRKHAN